MVDMNRYVTLKFHIIFFISVEKEKCIHVANFLLMKFNNENEFIPVDALLRRRK